MATLPDLLKTTMELGGSDLHLSTNSPPQVRVHGELQRLQLPELTAAETKHLVYSVLTDLQKKRFEETLELDFSFGIRGLARFRCNVFNQRGAVAAVYRLIPETIRPFGELGLPAVIGTLADRPRGLVLVTGPTGSGRRCSSPCTRTCGGELVERCRSEPPSSIVVFNKSGNVAI